MRTLKSVYESLSPLAELTDLSTLNLSGTRVSDISALAELVDIVELDLSDTNIVDISALQRLQEMITLNLSGTNISDITAIGNMAELEELDLSKTMVSNLAPLARTKSLGSLTVAKTDVSDLSPLKELVQLDMLVVAKTKVSDLSPIAELTQITELDISDSQVTNLTALAGYQEMSDSAEFGEFGLKANRCPLQDEHLVRIMKQRNPARTVNAIGYVRRKAGLPPFADDEVAEKKRKPQSGTDVEPLANIPSPFAFSLSENGIIVLESNKANWPTLPFQTSQRDHANRLETCRKLGTDLTSLANRQGFQARREYADGIEAYLSQLPSQPNEGNILLADAEARTLRNLFAAEVDSLPVAFASRLKTFLEQHIGLRVFYPELAHFYRDVQRGHLGAPLPLDAVSAFVEGVRDNTPAIFDPSVTDAIVDSAEPASVFESSHLGVEGSKDQEVPRPPKDPLGEIDPKKAWDFTFAGAANGLWKAFLAGEKINKALEGWKRADASIRPHANQILDWLHRFMASSDGAPPMPPTIGI